MKKTILLTVCSLMAMAMQAQTVSEQQARQTAAEFYQAHSSHEARSNKPYKSPTPSTLRKAYEAPQQALYVFNSPEETGFVIVAGKESSTPILGWSDNGPFDYDHAPCGLKAMLEQYAKGLSRREKRGERREESNKGNHAPRNNKDVGPIMHTEWNQTMPYNNYCPEGLGGDAQYGGRCPSGCVVVSFTQIMKYWRWPERGYGKHTSMKVPTFTRELSAYDWDNMLDSYKGEYNDQQAHAVATLMADAGCMMNTEYKVGGSPTFDAVKAMISNFGYAEDMVSTHYSRDSEEFRSIIEYEIDNNRPLVIIVPASNASHTVVCEGYRVKDDDTYYYLNYGWGGYGDGYYTTSSTYEMGSGMTGDIVYNIRPSYNPRVMQDNLCFEIGSNGEATVMGSMDDTSTGSTDIVIPPSVTYEGKACPVTRMYAKAFNPGPFTSLTMPGTIREIPDYAFMTEKGSIFYNCPLTSVKLGSGIKRIGSYAFHNDYASTTPTFTNLATDGKTWGDELEEIGEKAFWGCKNMRYLPPLKKIKYIGKEAFGVTSIPSVSFYSNGYVIDEWAFRAVPIHSAIGLENAAEIRGGNFQYLEGEFTVSPTVKYGLGAVGGKLDKIIIPKSVKDFTVGTVAWTRSYVVEEGHPNLSSSDGVLYNKDKTTMLRMPEIDREWAVVPAGVEHLADSAFAYYGYNRLVIPASVSQADAAFSYDPNGISMSCRFGNIVCLSPTPPTFAKEEFFNTREPNLQYAKLIVPIGSKTAYEQAPVWKNFGTISEEIHVGNPFCYQVQESFKTADVMGRNANVTFDGNANIPSSVNIGGQDYTVNYVTIGAFRGDDQLKTLSLPENCNMGDYAFHGCRNLTTANIGKSDSNHAFEDCPKLASMTMAEGGWSISSYAFANCPSLKTFTIPASANEVNDHAFAGSGLQEVTFTAPNTRLWSSAFQGNTGLKRINGLDNVVHMESYAFADCGLEGDLSFPGSVYMNAFAFENNPIETISFSAQQTSASGTAFSKCNRLYAYNVDAANPNMYSKDGMLLGYYDLDWGTHIATLMACPPMMKEGGSIVPRTHIVIPDGTQMVYVQLDNDVTALTIPASVQQFVASAFSGCNNLRTVVNLAPEPQDISRNPYLFSSTIFKEAYAATLRVPQGCVSKYRAAEGWKKFHHIEEIDPASVTPVTIGRQPAARSYNLQGQRVDEGYRGIVVSNGRKVLVK